MGKVSEYLEKLNSMQYEAVVSMGQPLLILAGAGSGKTRVITAKIAYLIEKQGFLPSSILAVTFTNKAAREMKNRVASLLGYSANTKFYETPMIRTFHSFGAWALRCNYREAGLPGTFSIYDDSDMLSFLKTIRKNFSKNDLKYYAKLISRAKDCCLSPDSDLFSISHDPDFRLLYKEYQKKLDDIGNVDFGDLILKAVLLLKKNRAVRERLIRRFKVIMVDEYQDSNAAQFELLKLLTEDGKNITVVGDDDQSIYRFRGAEVKNIINFPDCFKDTKIIRLEENYRSTSPILNVAGAVVKNNKGRLGKTLWTKRDGGAKPILVYLDSAEEEAEFCADLVSDGKKGTAILYRTNAQSRLFESVFTRRSIPYKIVGSLKFYEREEIKDIIAWSYFLMNSKDEVSFLRIINKPVRGIGKAGVEKILSSPGKDICEKAENSLKLMKGKGRKGVEDFLSIYNELSSSLEEEKNLSSFVKKLMIRSGFAEYYKAEDDLFGTDKSGNMDELINAADYYPAGKKGMAEFLENIGLDSSSVKKSDPVSEEEPDVTLITMHNTKGLEFKRVIITGLEDELFPGIKACEEEDIEEERRIFYVSITRAEDELYMTSCNYRNRWYGSGVGNPSRFIGEIPPELIDVKGAPRGCLFVSNYRIGDHVYHYDYGTGVVLKEWREGNEPIVLVQFENGRVLKFLTNYTSLDKISI